MSNSTSRSASSPKWIRPIEVFSLKRKARRSSVLQPLDGNILANSGQISNPFNIFGKLPQKRKIEQVEQDILENSCSLDSFAIALKKGESEPVSKSEPRWESSSCLPLDWSMKTRVRFMSCRPFPFRGSLRTCEEASGTTSFARCLHSQRVQECSVDTSANAKFHQQCQVWQHPALPWLKLFPRHQQHANTGTSSGFNTDAAIQDALFTDWCDSLRSLYQLLRTRQCPFFYVCGHTFTVLFRAAGIGGMANMHALLTPTTVGFRRLLRTHGIDFTLPIIPRREDPKSSSDSKPDQAEGKENEKVTKEEDIEEEEEEVEAGEFLESLGLSQQDFPSLNPKRRKLGQDEKDGEVESGPTSLVCVEGPELQGLMELLMSCQGRSLCVSSTGPLAGIPPTLLSPCAYHGATLRRIKARQGWIKQGEKNLHCVDLSGPILPNMVYGLATLFTATQDGDFSAVLASDLATTSFTSVRHDTDISTGSTAFAKESLKDCGLDPDFLPWLCTSSQRVVIHELCSKEGLYSWT